jgi:hypothetical protein
MEKNYILTSETKVNIFGIKLFRIKSTKKTKWAEDGELGGWVDTENTPNGDARISGNAQVYGNARVSGDGKIESNNDFCTFQNFGSENRCTIFFKCEDGLTKVVCGCFFGTLEQFVKQVIETHVDNIFAKSYLAIVEVVKIKFNTVT